MVGFIASCKTQVTSRLSAQYLQRLVSPSLISPPLTLVWLHLQPHWPPLLSLDLPLSFPPRGHCLPFYSARTAFPQAVTCSSPSPGLYPKGTFTVTLFLITYKISTPSLTASKKKNYVKIPTIRPRAIAHCCNPSYMGGGDLEDGDWRPAQAKSSQYPHLSHYLGVCGGTCLLSQKLRES
jgi:hypothetical protein